MMACVAYGSVSLWLLSLTVPYHFGSKSLSLNHLLSHNMHATTRKPLNTNVCMFCLVDVSVKMRAL